MASKHPSKAARAGTVTELSTRWQVNRAWVLRRIDRGELIAQDISLGGKRPTYRIDEAEANRFWRSLASWKTQSERRSKNWTPTVEDLNQIDADEGLDFEDFTR